MQKRRNWFDGVLIFLLLLPGGTSFAIASHSSPGAALPQAMEPSRMSRYLKELAREFSIDHTARRKDAVPQFGDVTTISAAPVNFDDCSVVWNQLQEGTASGQPIYIATHRFEVPLATMDAPQITVEPVRTGKDERPGIEAGDLHKHSQFDRAWYQFRSSSHPISDCWDDFVLS
jgi:hypothetical protein